MSLNKTEDLYCYINRHVKSYKDSFEDVAMHEEILKKCIKRDGHFSKTSKDFDQPIVLTCYKPEKIERVYGERQIFLKVYGKRKNVHLQFLPTYPTDIHKPTKLRELLEIFQSNNLQQIRDLKIVFKRPFKSACLGPKLFLKLYLNGNVPSFKEKLKKLREKSKVLECLDIHTIHDFSLSQDTNWFNAKRAYPLGYIKTLASDTYLENRGDYDDGQIHHEDLRFDNKEEIEILPNDVFDFVINRVHIPLMKKLAGQPSMNALQHCISEARKKFHRKCEPVMTWRKLKHYFIHNIFNCVLTIPRDNTVFDSFIKQYGGYRDDEEALVNKISIEKASRDGFFEILKIAYECKAKLKYMWLEKFLGPEADMRKLYQRQICRDISRKKLWLVFDIETNHRPHEIKEESIIAISTVLFNHDDSNVLEYALFLRMPEMQKNQYKNACNEVTVQGIKDLIRMNFRYKRYDDISSENFKIHFAKTEIELLECFQSYVKRTRSSFITYWNGHRFDLPFIVNRTAIHKAKSKAAKQEILRSTAQPRSMRYSFCYKRDEAKLGYERKVPGHTYMKHAREHFKNEIEEKRKIFKRESRKKDLEQAFADEAYASSPECTDSEEDNQLNEYEQNQLSQGGTLQGFLNAARKVESVIMFHTTVVDLMKMVGDMRCCKLDVAAKSFLGFSKMDDEEVSYMNLCTTWEGGNRTKLAAYAMIDSILTMELVKVTKINGFYISVSELIGLTERETYLNESVRRLISILDREGYRENMLTPDNTIRRSEEELYQIHREWNSEKDYQKLRPTGGSTVPNVKGLYREWIAGEDLRSQYPAEMIAYNLCASSLLDIESIDELGLVEGKDYIKLTLENVRPIIEHTCKEKGKKQCMGMIEGRGDPKKCSLTQRYERVEYDVYFASESFYKSMLNRASESLMEARSDYKKKRDEAYEKGNMMESEIYDLYQLSIKTVNNGLYGASGRLNGIVGDSITNVGRQQSRMLAGLAAKQGMLVVNGDTDSVYLQLMPDSVDCKTFGSVARALGNFEPLLPASDVINMLLEKAQKFADDVNNGSELTPDHLPLFPKPCFLEFEKMFMYLCNFKKKSYGGLKITPNMNVSFQKTGITGKKGDTTKVKSSTQFIALRLMEKGDFDGIFKFLKDMYDFSSWEIRHQNRKDQEISNLCEDIPNEPMIRDTEIIKSAKEKIKEILNKEEERSKDFSNYWMNPDWLVSKERVRNIDDDPPKTTATKKALEKCKYNGEPRHNADMYIDVIRNSAVQVASSIFSVLSVLLHGPANEGYEVKRDWSFSKFYGQERVKKIINKEIQEQQSEEKDENEVTRLSITAMPRQYRVKKRSRYSLSNRHRLQAEYLREYVIDREKAYDLEKKRGYDLHPINPPKVFDQRNYDEIKLRLCTFISDYRDTDKFPPLDLFSKEVTVMSKDQLLPDSSLPMKGIACDIWEMYFSDLVEMSYRYVAVFCRNENIYLRFSKTSVASDLHIIELKPNHWSWCEENIHCLTDHPGNIYVLDMEVYRKQTRSTPLIVPSYDGKKMYLVNKDSYVPNKANFMSFLVDIRLMNTLLESLDEGARIFIETVIGERKINLIEVNRKESYQIEISEIKRDDERNVDVWKWKETSSIFFNSSVKEALHKLTSGREKLTKPKFAVFQFDGTDKTLTISDEMEDVIIEIDSFSSESEINIIEHNDIETLKYIIQTSGRPRSLKNVSKNRCITEFFKPKIPRYDFMQ